MRSRALRDLGRQRQSTSAHGLHLADEGLETGDEPVVPSGHADHKSSEHDGGPDDVLDRGESRVHRAETTKHRCPTSLADEARLASVLRLHDGPIDRYRSTGRDNQRRPSAFFAALASLTPRPSVVLFFDELSMYADSMFTLLLPRRLAARASVPGLF